VNPGVRGRHPVDGVARHSGCQSDRSIRSSSPIIRSARSFILGIGVLFASGTVHAQVELRAKTDSSVSAAPSNDTIKEFSLQGVRIDRSGIGEQVISWDRVKRVGGEWAAKFEPFAPLADKAWRARTRLERGDHALAEPLFEELAVELKGQSGPTSSLVAEGLLRCRLARGAQSAAVLPWLTWISIVSPASSGNSLKKEQWIGGTCDASGMGAIDPDFLLPPSLPPVWVPGPALDSLLASKDWDTLTKLDGVPGQLATFYQQAAMFSAGTTSRSVDRASGEPTSLGARLVFDMLRSWNGDADQREAARAALRARFESVDKKKPASPRRWVEAWCRFAIGRSMIDETDESTSLLGVIELLHVPARFEEDQPYLAGMALAHASLTLAKLGDTQGAQTLKAELASKFPRHPALEWDQVRKLTPPPTRAKATP